LFFRTKKRWANGCFNGGGKVPAKISGMLAFKKKGAYVEQHAPFHDLRDLRLFLLLSVVINHRPGAGSGQFIDAVVGSVENYPVFLADN
jgi:hypothetical protein